MQELAWNIADLVFQARDDRVNASGAETVASERDKLDVRASVGGDHGAYARLVARYQPYVYQQMWRFTRDPHVQDELVQEVFVEVYRSLRKYRGDAPFLHWVRRIATRTGYRYWRYEARRRRLESALAQERKPAIIEPEASTATEAAELLHSLLAQLSAPERLVLTLTYFDDCNSTEIAARTGWSATLVRVRAYRARQKLKPLLEKAGFGRPGHE